MHTYTITLAFDASQQTVDAKYFIIEDEFTTFKDDDHKQIATFSNHHIVSIIRK